MTNEDDNRTFEGVLAGVRPGEHTLQVVKGLLLLLTVMSDCAPESIASDRRANPTGVAEYRESTRPSVH